MPEKIRMGHRVHKTRRRLLIALLPLLLAGSEAAHALVERFAPAGYEGHELSAVLVPVVIAVGLTAALVRLPRWAVALLPFATFALQEHLEYWAAHGRFPWALVLRWPFLAGLALQLPFAALAYHAAPSLVRLLTRSL
jgi:hypothetical protein